MQNRILLADDGSGIRQALARVFGIGGLRGHHRQTGRQAAEVCLTSALDLVLLDLNMPDKDGWEACCLIKTINSCLAMFILTARPNQLEKAVEMGVNTLVENPLDLSQLLKIIREVIEKPTERTVAVPEAEPVRFYFRRHLRQKTLSNPP